MKFAPQNLQAEKTELELILLNIIDTCPEVTGAMVMANTGELLAVLVPEDYEPDKIARYTLESFKLCQQSIEQMGHNQIHALLWTTPAGYMYAATFGDRLLVAVGRDFIAEQTINRMEFAT